MPGMDRIVTTFCALGLLFATGCAQQPVAPDNRETDARALREGEAAAFIRDWSGKDVDRIVDHYSDDGSVMVPNLPIITGKDAMRKALKDVLADPNWSLALEIAQVEVSKSGDLGYVRGTYVNSMTDPAGKKKAKVTEKGKFLTVFRKQAGGSWKAVQDMNNADAPAAPSRT
jgi:ketosteroid isomerase-like protein